MFDLIKQSVFASIGVALMTRDKVAELASDIAERSKLNKEEAAEFQDELADKAEEARSELQKEIDRRIDHAFIQFGLLKAGVKRDIEGVASRGELALEDAIESAIDRLGLARADDVKALMLRIEALEKKLSHGEETQD